MLRPGPVRPSPDMGARLDQLERLVARALGGVPKPKPRAPRSTPTPRPKTNGSVTEGGASVQARGAAEKAETKNQEKNEETRRTPREDEAPRVPRTPGGSPDLEGLKPLTTREAGPQRDEPQ